MRIGQLADRSGVSVRSLRYYEQQNLLLGTRTSGGQRTYDDEAVGRVEWIQLLFAAGLTSREIVQLLPCVHTGRTTPAMLEMLHAQRDRIAGRLDDLRATVERLDDVITESGRLLAVGPRA